MKARSYVIGGVVVLLLAGGFAWNRHRDASASPTYITAPVGRGEIVEHVHATGVIRPLRLVEVGTQVTGPVNKLFADFNDTVKAGQIVAQIDPATYEAEVAQDQASVVQSEASVEAAKARLNQAEQQLKRSQELADRKLIPLSELDASVADRNVLAAQLRVSEAALEQSRAQLQQSQTSLAYTTIRSPVDGVVIERKVDEGQTVVASMSAQTIFVVAADLQTVQVEANIPEADIGRVKEGQPVSFTVDAYEDAFTGAVFQVRLAGTSVENVVTYPVIIRATNHDDKLLPGMTANIDCEVARREKVLKVPNAALRFQPERPMREKLSDGNSAPMEIEREPMIALGPRVWVLDEDGGKPTPINVTIGISDGKTTEITGTNSLQEGQDVITGFAPGSKRPDEKVNPFAPNMPSRNMRRGLR